MTAELTEATAGANHVEPTSSTERIFAELLADVLGTDRVTIDGHFFDDLGADSLGMAQFCARARRRDDAPAVSIKDVYRHPTIAHLAAAMTDPAESTPADPARTAPTEAGADESPQVAPQPPSADAPATGQLLCGALQLLVTSTTRSPWPGHPQPFSISDALARAAHDPTPGHVLAGGDGPTDCDPRTSLKRLHLAVVGPTGGGGHLRATSTTSSAPP